MDKFLYFAYGSNVLASRLQSRCASAKPITTAIARNYTLEYTKPSKDNSSKATLIAQAGTHWHGRLFEIDEDEIKHLDSFEGAGYGYERTSSFEVIRTDTDSLETVTTYLATKRQSNLKPYDWYVALIMAGQIEAKLPQTQIDDPRHQAFLEDKVLDRDTRIQAIEVIERAGFGKISDLLAKRS